MHGIIFNELRKYATSKVGPGTWEVLLADTGLTGKTYLASQSYPDGEVVALVGAASKRIGLGAGTILEDFGEFIAPDLLAMFRSLLKSEWKTLDIVAHTEETIHKVVRVQYRDAAPPYLKTERPTPNHVTVIYTSPRQLCYVAKGIIRGIAKAFNEPVQINETSCMHSGAAACIIEVRT